MLVWKDRCSLPEELINYSFVLWMGKAGQKEKGEKAFQEERAAGQECWAGEKIRAFEELKESLYG